MEHVTSMREGMRGAVDQVATCQPTHIIMGVAIEAFWGGVKAADALQAELAERAKVGISMGSTALVAALHRYGARSIAILTPHHPRGDEQVRNYLEEAGFTVRRLIGMKCASPTLIAHTPPAQILENLRTLDGDDIDVLVQTGTNLAAIRLCADVERMLGKPLLAINSVTYWDALRRSGINDRLHGYGRILEEH